MTFTQPYWLLLMLIALPLAFWSWRRRVGGSRRLLNAVARFLCFVWLTVALARPVWHLRKFEETNVVAVDLGPTMPPDVIKSAIDQARIAGSKIVAFSNRAEIVTDEAALIDPEKRAALITRLNQPLWPTDPRLGGSALADGLQLAGAQISEGEPGTVKLFTNGSTTRGDAASEAFRLAQRGISIACSPADVSYSQSPTALIKSIHAPTSAHVGATILVNVSIESRIATSCTLLLGAGEAAPVTQTIALYPGMNEVDVSLPLHHQGAIPVVATLQTNRAVASADVLTALNVDGPQQVLVVSEDSGSSAALTALLGESAQVSTIGPDTLNRLALDHADLIVLADVPVDHLSPDLQQEIQREVFNGTGLLVTGAARSFGPGGYDSSSLSALIPVRTPQQMQKIDPSTTLVLIIDTSGSMGVRSKLDLAKEIARMAISHLRPNDKVGIVEFYGGRRWAAPIQPVANSTDVTRALNRLTVGGGTKLFPAFEEAAFALHNVQTRTKHVMIISDGDVEDAPFDALARQMAEEGVMVSTVACSPTEGTTTLQSIAEAGRGRYYLVPDEFELPDISLKQPQTSMLSPMVETPSRVAMQSDGMLMEPVSGEIGVLNGYVRTSAKPTADVLLKAGDDPLLTRWRCGAGWVAAMPTQLGSDLAGDLEKQPAFSQLINGLVRQLCRDRRGDVAITPKLRPAGIEVDIRCDVTASSHSPVELSLFDSRGEQIRTVNEEPVQPGHWNGLLIGLPAGLYTIRGHCGNDNGQAAVLVPTARVPSALFPDLHLLKTIGDFAPLAAKNAAALTGSIELIELRKPLIIAAILFLLLDVLVRRWRWSST